MRTTKVGIRVSSSGFAEYVAAATPVPVTRHGQPLRTLAEISAGVLTIEKEAEGLLDGLLVGEQR